MAFKTTGTSTDYRDLLTDFRTWITATAGWTELAYSTVTDSDELYLRGDGTGADGRVFINIKTELDSVNGYYGWAIYGATDYDSGSGITAQPGVIGPSYFNTWDSSIDYWFYANDRRFIIVAQVSTSYVSMYAGFGLPFALPSEHQFPLFICGNYGTLDAYNSNNSRNRFIIDPGEISAFYKTRNNANRTFGNHASSTTAIHLTSTSREIMLWPMRTGRYSTVGDDATQSNDWSRGGFTQMKLNFNDETMLFQTMIIDQADSVVMGLDGVYAICGDSRTSEQTVTNGGRTFRLFQNISRNTARDFMAIEEV